jgi:hypothetical protein
MLGFEHRAHLVVLLATDLACGVTPLKVLDSRGPRPPGVCVDRRSVSLPQQDPQADDADPQQWSEQQPALPPVNT